MYIIYLILKFQKKMLDHYYGEITCQSIVKSTNLPCKNQHQFIDHDNFLNKNLENYHQGSKIFECDVDYSGNITFESLKKRVSTESIILKDATKRLRNIISKYIDINTFDTFLSQTGAMVSGSSILSSILNENWGISDFDIFIPVKNQDDIFFVIQFFTDLSFFVTKSFNVIDENYTSDFNFFGRNDFNNDKYLIDQNILARYVTYLPSQLEYNTLNVKEGEKNIFDLIFFNSIVITPIEGRENKLIKTIIGASEYITQMFDIDILMGYYNEKGINVENTSLMKIFNKEMTMISRRHSSPKRVIKYEKRGFKIYNEKGNRIIETPTYLNHLNEIALNKYI